MRERLPYLFGVVLAVSLAQCPYITSAWGLLILGVMSLAFAALIKAFL